MAMPSSGISISPSSTLPNEFPAISARGALVYEGARGTDAAHMSIWHFQVLGGATMQDENGGGAQEEIANVVALVGRREFVERIKFD